MHKCQGRDWIKQTLIIWTYCCLSAFMVSASGITYKVDKKHAWFLAQ